MKVLVKYLDKMSNARMAECFVVLELVKKGYKISEARRMVNNSRLKECAEEDPVMFFHRCPESWADELAGYAEELLAAAN